VKEEGGTGTGEEAVGGSGTGTKLSVVFSEAFVTVCLKPHTLAGLEDHQRDVAVHRADGICGGGGREVR
jgi:hypothetical protein